MADSITPTDAESAAAALAGAAAYGMAVRIVGGATKRDWGAAGNPAAIELHTTNLQATLEHNASDLTAIFQAGVPLARAQEELAAKGQMLALDPPLSATGRSRATLGGVFATADCGPLQHRYGQPRDLVLGITVALSDGTLARAGGKVIKNVAGYDLGKLFTGSFGTLGLIVSLSVRLHTLPPRTATAFGTTTEPAALTAAALTLARAPLELETLDVSWRDGRGELLAQSAGARATLRSGSVAALMRSSGLDNVHVVGDDASLWARQRAGQRSTKLAIVRAAWPPRELASALRAAQACGGAVVARAALGIGYVELDPAAIVTLRELMPRGTLCVVQDLPWQTCPAIDPWPHGSSGALELMRRVKRQFDPAAVCNPGVFVGGI